MVNRPTTATSSGYALAFGLALVPARRPGDARSRRDVFLVGITLFTLSSAADGARRTWCSSRWPASCRA